MGYSCRWDLNRSAMSVWGNVGSDSVLCAQGSPEGKTRDTLLYVVRGEQSGSKLETVRGRVRRKASVNSGESKAHGGLRELPHNLGITNTC